MTPLAKQIQKEELKEVFTEALEPFVDSIKEDFNKIDERFNKIDERFNKIDGRLDRIEATMVTKSYLDNKLADIEGGLIGKLRKEDEKVNRLIEVLKNKSLLTAEDTQQFKEFQIFPKV